MIDIAILRAMAAAGATVDVIISAIELAVQPELERRAGNADRQRRYRERKALRNVASRDVGVTLPLHNAQGPLSKKEEERTVSKEERERPLTRPARKRALSPKVPIPEEWFPEGQVTPAECRELEKMKDWAKSNAIRKADWEATWRNWKRRAPEFIGNGIRPANTVPRPGSREDSLEKTRVAYAKFCEHAAAGADDKGAGNAAGQASLRLISNDKFT
jgi:hypothetical protein